MENKEEIWQYISVKILKFSWEIEGGKYL